MELRVLQVLPELESGGVERGTLEIAGYLTKQGVKALVASNGGKLVDGLVEMGIEHIKLPLQSKNPITIIINAFRLRSIIDAHKITLVHARSRAPAWSAYLACLMTSARFITTFHGIYGSGNSVKRFYNSVMLKGDRVIAVSNFIKKHIETKYHYISSKLHVINRCADLSFFNRQKVTPQQINDLKKDLKLSDNAKIILFPSRVSRNKGHLFLIQALSLIRKADFYCIMVGRCTENHFGYKEEILTAIKEAKLQNKVILLDHVENMLALYAVADLMLAPSQLPEPFGRTVVEAFAMEVPVIATRVGAFNELIEDQVNGFLCSARDSSDLADKITLVCSLDKKAITKITDRALKDVREKYSLEQMCENTLKVYNSAIEGFVDELQIEHHH